MKLLLISLILTITLVIEKDVAKFLCEGEDCCPDQTIPLPTGGTIVIDGKASLIISTDTVEWNCEAN